LRSKLQLSGLAQRGLPALIILLLLVGAVAEVLNLINMPLAVAVRVGLEQARRSR
jgi:hypothetical protein